MQHNLNMSMNKEATEERIHWLQSNRDKKMIGNTSS